MAILGPGQLLDLCESDGRRNDWVDALTLRSRLTLPDPTHGDRTFNINHSFFQHFDSQLQLSNAVCSPTIAPLMVGLGDLDRAYVFLTRIEPEIHRLDPYRKPFRWVYAWAKHLVRRRRQTNTRDNGREERQCIRACQKLGMAWQIDYFRYLGAEALAFENYQDLPTPRTLIGWHCDRRADPSRVHPDHALQIPSSATMPRTLAYFRNHFRGLIRVGNSKVAVEVLRQLRSTWPSLRILLLATQSKKARQFADMVNQGLGLRLIRSTYGLSGKESLENRQAPQSPNAGEMVFCKPFQVSGELGRFDAVILLDACQISHQKMSYFLELSMYRGRGIPLFAFLDDQQIVSKTQKRRLAWHFGPWVHDVPTVGHDRDNVYFAKVRYCHQRRMVHRDSERLQTRIQTDRKRNQLIAQIAQSANDPQLASEVGFTDLAAWKRHSPRSIYRTAIVAKSMRQVFELSELLPEWPIYVGEAGPQDLTLDERFWNDARREQIYRRATVLYNGINAIFLASSVSGHELQEFDVVVWASGGIEGPDLGGWAITSQTRQLRPRLLVDICDEGVPELNEHWCRRQLEAYRQEMIPVGLSADQMHRRKYQVECRFPRLDQGLFYTYQPTRAYAPQYSWSGRGLRSTESGQPTTQPRSRILHYKVDDLANFELEQFANHESLFQSAEALRRNARRSNLPDGNEMANLSNTEMFKICRSLKASLLDRSYHPHQVHRVSIPKTSGGVRVLEIQRLRDRIVDKSLLHVMVNELSTRGIAYRPRVDQMMLQLEKAIRETGRLFLATDDIENFFPSVPLSAVMSSHDQLFSPNGNLRWLLNKVIHGAGGNRREIGLIQGSPYSPMAAHLLLHHNLDQAWASHEQLPLLRYVDNVCLLAASRSKGERAIQRLQTRLRSLELRLKGEDGPPVDLRNPNHRLKFLGYVPRWKDDHLEFDLTPQAFRDLNGRIAAQSLRGNPWKWVRSIVRGWITGHALAFRGSYIPRVRDSVLRFTARYGINELTGEQIEMWAQKAYGNWIEARNAFYASSNACMNLV